jgi:hypothetical protein
MMLLVGVAVMLVVLLAVGLPQLLTPVTAKAAEKDHTDNEHGRSVEKSTQHPIYYGPDGPNQRGRP